MKRSKKNLKIKIGTRASPLALAQTDLIAREIFKFYPDSEISIIKIKTSGDKNMQPFSSDPAGIKGLFTLELEQALLNHEIDFAVHSLKDLPANINKNLPIVAYSRREDPRDVLIIRNEKLEIRNFIGSSSLRRRLQLEKIFPEKKIIPVRGNVNTRIKKLDDGEFDALVLAAAGLKRLGLENRISRIFDIDEILPAPGQGILACQGRANENYFYLECVNDNNSKFCALAERSFSRALNAGCNLPVGAFAEISGEILTLRGLYIDEKTKKFYRGVSSGKIFDAEKIGENLAKEIFL
ncbi:MAG: hydroxymethylbilane synthase [Synergistaceae bacterium]|nr:hydroxymethylbilane synthase [Synergistaceae bacterium]